MRDWKYHFSQDVEMPFPLEMRGVQPKIFNKSIKKSSKIKEKIKKKSKNLMGMPVL